MKLLPLACLCFLLGTVTQAQVIRFQSVGGAGTVSMPATNGTIKHSMALGTAVSQGTTPLNAYNQAGFFFGNIDYRPALQASDILFSDLEPTQLTLMWSNGNGVRRVVVGHASSPVNAALAASAFYGDTGASPSFGTGTEVGVSTGNFVVYDGMKNSVTITNLSPSTEYNFKVFEYNGKYGANNVNIEYQTGDGLSNNPSKRTTLAVKPLNNANTPAFTNVTKNQSTLSWVNGDGTKRLVLIKEGNVVDALPQNGLGYTADALFTTSPELSNGNHIVFDGATNQVTVTGLLPNTVYHYQVIEYKGSGLDNNYLTPSSAVASQLTLTQEPVAIDESGITQTGFSANWQQVDGAMNYYLDISDNAGFTSYVANYQNKKITGALIATVTGLTAGTTYYYRVRAENAAGQSANSNAIDVLTIPATPTVLSSNNINITTTSFTANWSASASATEYFIDVATDEGFTQFVNGFSNKPVSTNVSDVTGLTGGTNYYLRIRAKNSSGVSPDATSGYKQITKTVAPELLPTTDSDITKSDFKVLWKSVVGADEYEVTVLDDVNGTLVGTFIAVQPQTQVFAKNLESSTGYRYYVRAKNAAGYSASSNIELAFTKNENGGVSNAPSILIDLAQSTITSVRAQVRDGIAPLTVTFGYKPITSNTFATVEPFVSQTIDFSRTQPIDPSWADELGVEYYFDVVDKFGRKTSTGSAYIYKSFKEQNIPGFTGFDGRDEGYKMFSIPADLKDNNDIETIFQPVRSQFTGYHKDKWRLFHYPGGIDQEYLEYDTDLDKIEQGWGYWFNARENPAALSITAGVIRGNQKEPFRITLKQGWNQIGNPYPFNILWSAVQAANPEAELKRLWLFNPNPVPQLVLPAWQGAFVFSAKGGPIEFPVIARTTQGNRTASPEFPAKPDDGIWRVPLEVSCQSLHHRGAIGMHPEASNDLDKFDEPTLPRFIHFLEMKTRHENSFVRNFSEDVVKSDTYYTWSFTMSSDLRDGDAELNWPDLNLTWEHANSSLMLLDVSQQVLLDMKTANRYRFPFENGKQFKIIFSEDGKYEMGLTRLGEAYPNPFKDRITVPVLVEQENETMRLEVFDLLGKRLISVQRHFPVPGQYSFEWDGRTALGDQSPDGLLLYHVRKGDGSVTQVKRLIKSN